MVAVIGRPSFYLVWVLLAVGAVAFAVDLVVYTSAFLLAVEGALLALVGLLAVVQGYQSSQIGRSVAMGQGAFGAVLEGLEDAVIAYEEGFRAVFFNGAAERLFGVPAKSVINHVFSPRDIEQAGWRTLIQVIFPSLAPRIIVRSSEGEALQVVDISFSDPNLELRVTTLPLRDDSGKMAGFIKIIRDRTAFIEAIRSKSEFVTVASHQLRTPVTEVTWALESLSHAEEMNDTDKTIVTTALASSRGLARRIEDLLNIAKMEEGQFGYSFEESDPVDFIAKTLADVLPSADRAGVKLYFDRPASALPPVFIDPKRLSLALVNLLENAIRYNVQNGEVVVKADQAPDKPFVVVSVKDTGIGIPPEDMPKLFNKFYRAENAMKLQTEGSGLGLYIVRGIIRAHGGDIWVESELNRGSTFTFTLPTDQSLVPQREAGLEFLG